MTMSEPAPAAPARAARVRPVPSLRFERGATAGTTIRLTEDEGTLGRRTDNDYVVADPGVSRVHARLTRTNDSVILTDLGSSGGTTVNGDAVTGARVIQHGDTVEFGGAACVLDDPVAAASPGETTVVMQVPEEASTGPSLSPRQAEVLELIAEGMTNAEIGDRLGITERTVKAYAQELYVKLDVSNRAGAVAEGIRSGLL